MKYMTKEGNRTMKKSFIQRIINYVLSAAIAVTAVLQTSITAVHAEEAAGTYTVVETYADHVKVRTNASSKGSVIEEVPSGTLLYVTGSVTNKAGNLWYKVITADGDGYVYSRNVTEHIHNMTEDESTGFALCRCGYYQVKQTGIVQQSAAAALPLPIFGPEAVGDILGAGALESAGTAVGELVLTAAPYVLLAVTVFGLLYLTINVTKTSWKVTRFTFEDFDFLTDYYYKCYRLEDRLIFINPNGMNLTEAGQYLKDGMNMLTGGIMYNIYTPVKNSADALGDYFCSLSRMYAYGNSKGKSESECHGKTPDQGYFEHYHIGNKLTMALDACDLLKDGRKNFRKLSDMHIFFGLPGCVKKPVSV